VVHRNCERDKIMVDLGLSILLSWHVASVVIWLGSSFAFSFAVSPALEVLSQEERASFLRPALSFFSKMVASGSISAVLAGTILFGYVSSIDTSRMPGGWNLIFISVGAVLGLVGVILTIGVVYPLARRIMRDLARNQPDFLKENQVLSVKNPVRDTENKIRALSSLIRSLTIMLLIVVVLMTLGVYF
jgi:MFS family permease